MELFNIGPLEFILIILLAVVFVGPERMVKGAYSLGRWINKFVRSPMWKEIMSTSRDIRELPTKIVRESGLEESLEEIKKTSQEVTTELNSTLQEANAEVKQAVEDANAEVRQATTELNDTTRQALSEANQEVGKISNPDGLAEPKISETSTVDPVKTQVVNQPEGQLVGIPVVQPVITMEQVLEAARESPPVEPVETQVAGQIEGQLVGIPVVQPVITMEQVLEAARESPPVDSVEQQVADREELKPMPVLSHLQEVLPEILPREPDKPAVLQPATDPVESASTVSPIPLEELYEAKLNQVLEQYEVELKKILEQYKADLKKVAPPVEEFSHPVETAIQDK